MSFCAKRSDSRPSGCAAARRKAAEEHGNWDEWRERGRQIRLHTIAHLDYYLNLFADNARANGVHVHFADTSAEAVKISLAIAEQGSQNGGEIKIHGDRGAAS